MHHLLLKKITKTLGLGWFGVVYSWSLIMYDVCNVIIIYYLVIDGSTIVLPFTSTPIFCISFCISYSHVLYHIFVVLLWLSAQADGLLENKFLEFSTSYTKFSNTSVHFLLGVQWIRFHNPKVGMKYKCLFWIYSSVFDFPGCPIDRDNEIFGRASYVSKVVAPWGQLKILKF
jgi:hypothetical protein